MSAATERRTGDGAPPGEAVGSAAKLRPRPAEIVLFGYRLHPRTRDEVIAEIEAAVVGGRRLVMANVNLHGMAVMFDSPSMAALLAQDDALVAIDSMPVLFLAKLMGFPLARDKRTTSLDFYDEMFSRAAAGGWRIAYVGGEPDTLDTGLALLRRRFPGVLIDGRHGFFDVGEETPGSHHRQIVDWLAAESHDIVIVGMGMPRQEEWIARVQGRVGSRVFLPAGAYLDYQVGVQRPAPRWLGQLGLEWAYRLAHSPRRLGYRYLVEPFVLAFRLAVRAHPQRRSAEGPGRAA